MNPAKDSLVGQVNIDARLAQQVTALTKAGDTANEPTVAASI